MKPEQLQQKYLDLRGGGSPISVAVNTLISENHSPARDVMLLDLLGLVLREMTGKSHANSLREQANAFPVLSTILDYLGPSDSTPNELHDLAIDLFFRAYPMFAVSQVRHAHGARASNIRADANGILTAAKHDQILVSIWSGCATKGQGDLFAAAAWLRAEQPVDSVPRAKAFSDDEIPTIWAKQIKEQVENLRARTHCRTGRPWNPRDPAAVAPGMASLHWVGQGRFQKAPPDFKKTIRRLAMAIAKACPGEWLGEHLPEELELLLKVWAAQDAFTYAHLTSFFNEVYPRVAPSKLPTQFDLTLVPPDAPTFYGLLVGEPKAGKSSFLAACHSTPRESTRGSFAMNDEQPPFKALDSGYVPVQAHTPEDLLNLFENDKPSLTVQKNITLQSFLSDVGRISVADVPGGVLRPPQGALYNVNDPWLHEHIERRKPCGLIVVLSLAEDNMAQSAESLEPLAEQLQRSLGAAVSAFPIYFVVNKTDLLIDALNGDDHDALEELRNRMYRDPEAPVICSTRFEVPVSNGAPQLTDLINRRETFAEPALAALALRISRETQPAFDSFWKRGFQDVSVLCTCLRTNEKTAGQPQPTRKAYFKAAHVMDQLTRAIASRSMTHRRRGVERVGNELSAIKTLTESLEQKIQEASTKTLRAREELATLNTALDTLKASENDLAAFRNEAGAAASQLDSGKELIQKRFRTATALTRSAVACQEVVLTALEVMGIAVDGNLKWMPKAQMFEAPDRRPLDQDSINSLSKWIDDAPARATANQWSPCITFEGGCLTSGCDCSDLPWPEGAVPTEVTSETSVLNWLADSNHTREERQRTLQHICGSAIRLLETIPFGSRNASHAAAIKEFRRELRKSYGDLISGVVLPAAEARRNLEELSEEIQRLPIDRDWERKLSEKLASLKSLDDPMDGLSAATEEFQKTLKTKLDAFNEGLLTNTNKFQKFSSNGALNRIKATKFIAHLEAQIAVTADYLGYHSNPAKAAYAAAMGYPNKANCETHLALLRQCIKEMEAAEEKLAAAEKKARAALSGGDPAWELSLPEKADVPDMVRLVADFQAFRNKVAGLKPAETEITQVDVRRVACGLNKPAVEGVGTYFSRTAAKWMQNEHWFEGKGIGEPQPHLKVAIASMQAWCVSVAQGKLVRVNNEKVANPSGKIAIGDFELRRKALLAAMPEAKP